MAGGDHRHAVGQELRLVHVVGREQHGLPQLGQALHHLPGLPAGRGIEAGGRLVEEEQLGVADEGHPDVEAPLLAAREGRDAGVAFRPEADEVDDLPRRPGVGVEARVHGERLGDGQVPVDPGRLQHDADARLQGGASRPGS